MGKKGRKERREGGRREEGKREGEKEREGAKKEGGKRNVKVKIVLLGAGILPG